MFFYFWFGLFSSYLTAYLTLVYGLAFLGLLLPVVSSVLPRLVLVVGPVAMVFVVVLLLV